MLSEHSLEALHERFEKLVIRRTEPSKITQDERQRIADKFANMPLQELHEVVQQLKTTSG